MEAITVTALVTLAFVLVVGAVLALCMFWRSRKTSSQPQLQQPRPQTNTTTTTLIQGTEGGRPAYSVAVSNRLFKVKQSKFRYGGAEWHICLSLIHI